MTKAAFNLRGRNPDVLTCIANLSNDAVFTPPELANSMLDTLSEAWAAENGNSNIWSDPDVRFLDPFTKSGVFLREIVSRLTNGLAEKIPDLSDRLDHILTKQVFGIATETLTALLARRSVYCSKYANGPHSVAKSFDSESGNIWFERTEHSWVGGTNRVLAMNEGGEMVERTVDGRCKFCRAPRSIFDRPESLESHAYTFIHTDDIKARVAELFGAGMHFDVVIGNPPYQMSGGAGGSSDSSIYHLFVEQAIRLEPRFLSMVVPSRWMAGGRGMDDFRKSMLTSGHLLELVDYPVSKEVFPGVEVKGGICNFVWSLDHNGATKVTTKRDGLVVGPFERILDEFDVFVRDTRSLTILRKVLAHGEPSIASILTADTPFGIATNFSDFSDSQSSDSIALHYVRQGRRSVGYIKRSAISKNSHLIDDFKVLVPKAGSDGGQKIPDMVLGRPLVTGPPSVCTQTFLAFTVSTELEASSVEAYYRTKLFRFLVSLRKITQDALKSTYTWVPTQTWDRNWTDEDLYAKYSLAADEIDFVESVIRPMEPANE
jgi:site-specific DNA-methyltransferase (adenine-specific)